MIESFFKNENSLKKWRRFKSNKIAITSSIVLLFFILLTLISPILANNRPIILKYNGKIYYPIFKKYSPRDFSDPDSITIDFRNLKLEKSRGDYSIWPIIQWNPYESNEFISIYPGAPTKDNWFGTDDSGRDVLTRLLYGFKYSIFYALIVWAISYTIGIVVGGLMGYFGGWIDLLGQRLVEIWSTIPQLLLLIIIIATYGPSMTLLVIVTSLFGWVSISYYIRGEFFKQRKQEYVESARAIGLKNFKIIFKHILPNSLSPVLTFTPFFIAGNIAGLAALDYLGFGLEVPTPSWGELLKQGKNYSTTAWWLTFYPSACLCGTLILVNAIGEGIRDALDPKKGESN